MEFVQFHPTGMVWPPSVRGILVTEGVRGDGGTLRNKNGERFMFNYIPEFFKGETADNEAEADRWYEDKRNNRRTPDLLPRDEVARAINTEVKAGRGSPHGGAFLDICTRRPADYIRKRLPSMYHQFKELADVDITKEPMEVGPTCHYVMGGVRVDADSAAATVPGLFAAGEVAGGMHGANRLGGNSLSDLLVFGRRAGLSAALYAKNRGGQLTVDQGQVDAVAREVIAPFNRTHGENPYALQAELQETMQTLVGIIRTESELREADEGMVGLDGIHRVQATQANDLACRWNCKASKCGSCSAEVNGKPRLMCMTRMNLFREGEIISVAPIRAFPIIRDLVTNVAYNYEKAKAISPLRLKPPAADGTYRMMQEDIDRIQEFHKCIECFLCHDVCHVIRDHEAHKKAFAGPRFFIKLAGLEMHPLDAADRTRFVRREAGIGLCNITKCCTEVCPEHIHITDNGIIPLKERMADDLDPIVWLLRRFRGMRKDGA